MTPACKGDPTDAKAIVKDQWYSGPGGAGLQWPRVIVSAR